MTAGTVKTRLCSSTIVTLNKNENAATNARLLTASTQIKTHLHPVCSPSADRSTPQDLKSSVWCSTIKVSSVVAQVELQISSISLLSFVIGLPSSYEISILISFVCIKMSKTHTMTFDSSTSSSLSAYFKFLICVYVDSQTFETPFAPI